MKRKKISRRFLLAGMSAALVLGCVGPNDPNYDSAWLVPDFVNLEYNGAVQDTRWGGQPQRGAIHGGTIGFTWAITKDSAMEAWRAWGAVR